MMKIIYGILYGIAAYGFVVFVYSEGFEAGRDHQLKIEGDPNKFVRDLVQYLNSGSERDAERLESYGIRRAWWGHHSEKRKVVTMHGEQEL